MRKALTLLIALTCANLALAQNRPLACQDDEAAGLQWESGEWRVARFKLQKVILVMSGDTLTKESAANAMDSPPQHVRCSTDDYGKMISCVDRSGRSLVFMPKTLKGAVSSVFGATMYSTEQRDSVFVRAFTCQPY